MSDKINNKTLLDAHDMLFVNRINAQTKLTEGWISPNIEKYLTKLDKSLVNRDILITRSYQLSRDEICVANFMPPANGAS